MKPSPNKSIFAAAALGLFAAAPGHAQSPARKNRPAPAAAQPPPPADKAAAEPTASETEILAMQGAQFSAKERIATFTGDVRVTDPRFQLACDELTVYLKKTSAAKPAEAAPDADGKPTPAAADPQEGDNQGAMGGGIDHAIAKGHVIIVQERPATDGGAPKRSVGRGERADFDNNTGDMVLHGLPSVEQNGNTHVATSPNTIMTLRRDNSLATKGPSRTLIIQRKGEPSPAAAASPAPNP